MEVCISYNINNSVCARFFAHPVNAIGRKLVENAIGRKFLTFAILAFNCFKWIIGVVSKYNVTIVMMFSL